MYASTYVLVYFYWRLDLINAHVKNYYIAVRTRHMSCRGGYAGRFNEGDCITGNPMLRLLTSKKKK